MELPTSMAYCTRSLLISVIMITLCPNDGTSQNEPQLTTGGAVFYDILKNDTIVQGLSNITEEYTTTIPDNVSSVSTVGSGGSGWEVENFPNPLINPHECGMKKRQFVCDPDHVLNALEVARIMNITLSIRFNIDFCACKAGCPKGMKGYAFAVAVVKQIKYKNRIPQTAKEKSVALQYFGDYLRAKKWKYGYCDNDGIIVLVTESKMIYTSLGWWAIVRIIPPQICIANATAAADKYIKEGKYGQAIVAILEKYHKYLLHGNCEEDIFRPDDGSGNYSDPVVWILIGCIAVVFILLLILVIVFKPKKDDSETTALRTSFDDGHSNEAFSQTLDIYPDDRA